jgi:hypothetical protein
MPEPPELELLNGRNKPINVIVFANDAEGEGKDRILRIDRFERVITTLVNEDDVVGEEQDRLS